jgi:hypothetical protein
MGASVRLSTIVRHEIGISSATMGVATAKLITPWDVPTYTAAETGRLVGLQPSRVRRSLRGYEYDVAERQTSTTRRVRQIPVIHRGDNETPFASFLDLVDLHS